METQTPFLSLSSDGGQVRNEQAQQTKNTLTNTRNFFLLEKSFCRY